VPFGFAAHATRAVSTGTAEPELRPIDIPQSQHRDALSPGSDAPHRPTTKITNNILSVICVASPEAVYPLCSGVLVRRAVP